MGRRNTDMIKPLKAMLETHKERVRSRNFLHATMAASALVAMADGSISFAELLGRDHVLNRIDRLQAFDSTEAVDCFRYYAEALTADADAGAALVFDAVIKISEDTELSQLLLRAAVAIAKADSNLSQAENDAIESLCDVLGMEELEITFEPGSD